MEFVYDAFGRRVETIEYVDAATGAVLDGAGGNAQPRRTRHVYFGLEVIQEYACGGGEYVSGEARRWARKSSGFRSSVASGYVPVTRCPSGVVVREH